MSSAVTAMDQIVFENVSYSYDGKTNALDSLSFSIKENDFICILGGNGSGKSTLAKCINALLVPDSGEVKVLGLNTSDQENTFAIRSNAGMVFQNPDDQIVASIVEDDVAFGPENLGIPNPELQNRVEGALKAVGLQSFGKRETTALSGGQKQRVAIAGALAMRPRILILDEASAMLDPRGRKDLMRLCRQLYNEGFTIVLITHFMEEAAQSNRVLIMRNGTAVLDGTPEEILIQAKSLEELSLDIPFSVSFSLALQKENIPIKTFINQTALEDELKKLLEDKINKDIQDFSSINTEYAPKNAVNTSITEKQNEKAKLETSDKEPFLSFNDVSFSYVSKTHRKEEIKSETMKWGDTASNPWALRHVSFTLHLGDFLGIAGHTGSGKSTLIQLANGLLKPTEGSIFVNGHNLADKKVTAEARRNIGLVFQYPEHQLFAPTVFEDVAFGPKNLGLGADEIEQRVQLALNLVHLNYEEVREKSPFSLSGGQQRRVALAGVLAMEPEVLILDEPTVGLDPKAHEALLELISEFHKKQNLTVIMVSHSMDDLAALCNRILLLNKGTIIANDAPSTVFADEKLLRSIGLNVPHTMEVINALSLEKLVSDILSTEELAQLIAKIYQGNLAI